MIELKLSQEEVNILCHALGELPLKISGPVFTNIQAQIQKQADKKITVSEYEMLATQIHNKELPSDQVQKIMRDEVFAAWYDNKHPSNILNH